ncbi:hypothetical protein INR49_020404 [Caranx melampygus]|nr:hypothetical protein INR49_020404 [Caranx melampygus]
MMLSALTCGAAVFPGLFFSFRKILRSWFTHWTEADVVCVSERLVSAIHASLATAAGVTVVTSCSDVMRDSQKVRGQISEHEGHSLKTVKLFLRKDAMLILHHLTLLLLGLDSSRLHQLNGLVVLMSFFTCRILIFPFMYWMYGQQFGLPLHRVPSHLPLHCNVGNLVILAPQVYWFILLLKKARRLYLRQRRRDGDKDGLKTN